MNSKTAAQNIGGILISLGLGGCGGGGGGDPPPDPSGGQSTSITISGTAAAGAPLAGRVTIKDSLGTVKTVNLAANGTYSIDVSGLTPPFVLRAEGTTGGRSYVLHSGATAADRNGTINITPFTELIIGNIARQVAANYFDAGNVTGLTAAQLDAAETELQQRLQPVLTDLGIAASIDLLRAAFNADHKGLDAALDLLRVTVDKSTNTATIVNVLDNAAITDDLTTNDTGIINSTIPGTYASDWDAIRARWASFEAVFATKLPAVNDPLLLAQFDQTGFLDNGDDLTAFLANLTSPNLVGIKFPSLTLVSLTPATPMGNGRAVVILGLGDATYGIEYIEMVMTGLYSSGGTNWVIAGDQHIAETGADIGSVLDFKPSYPALIRSGIRFWNDVGQAGSEIDYAVITGPGLPTAGGGVDGNSPGVLLVGGYSSMYLAASPYRGSSTPIHSRAEDAWDWGEVYIWTDEEIAALPSDNLTYTETFYSDNGTLTNFTDDIELASYQFTVLKPPLAAGSLSSNAFPVVTSPTSTQILGVYAAGGPLNLTWTLPPGLAMDEVEIDRVYNNGGHDSISTEDSPAVGPTNTSMTFQLTPGTSTVTGGWVTLVAKDFYQRLYQYRLWLP